MKIIQVIPTLCKAGGAERFVVDLAIAEKRLGHDVLLIVLYNDETNFYEKDILQNNIRLINLNKRKGFDLKNSLLLRKEILKFNPDIVHTHLNSHLSMKLSFLWTKNKNIAFVHTIHSVPEKERPKGMLYSMARSLYKKKIVIPACISANLSYLTEKYYKLKYKPISIYNGIFLDKFSSNISLEKRKFFFISVARFSPLKNQIMIARATIDLKRKGLAVNTLFLGGGIEFNNVKKFVDENNASQFIDFKGEVNNVNDYLEDSKCLVIPSWVEGNPISVLEAMASGLAIIATKNGGAKDVVEDGVNGFIVDPYNLDELVEKMETIYKNIDLLEKFSRNNIEKVKQFDMVNVAQEYIKLYKDNAKQ